MAFCRPLINQSGSPSEITSADTLLSDKLLTYGLQVNGDITVTGNLSITGSYPGGTYLNEASLPTSNVKEGTSSHCSNWIPGCNHYYIGGTWYALPGFFPVNVYTDPYFNTATTTTEVLNTLLGWSIPIGHLVEVTSANETGVLYKWDGVDFISQKRSYKFAIDIDLTGFTGQVYWTEVMVPGVIKDDNYTVFARTFSTTGIEVLGDVSSDHHVNLYIRKIDLTPISSLNSITVIGECLYEPF